VKATAYLHGALSDTVRADAAHTRLDLVKRSLERRTESLQQSKQHLETARSEASRLSEEVKTSTADAQDKKMAMAQSKEKIDEVRASLLNGAAMSAVTIAAKAAKQEMAAIAATKTDGSEHALDTANIAKAKAEHASATAKVDIMKAKEAELMVKKAKGAAEKARVAVIQKARARAGIDKVHHAEADKKTAEAQKKAAEEMSSKAIQRTIDAAASSVNSPTYIQTAADAMQNATREVAVANQAAELAAETQEKAAKVARTDMARAEEVMQRAKAQAEAAREEMATANKAVTDANAAGSNLASMKEEQRAAASNVAKAEHQAVAAAAVLQAVALTKDKVASMRHGNVSRATNESNFDDSKPFVTANGETIEEKSLNLAAMHKRLKLALKKQVGANTGVENAKHELNVAKTDVELRTEMLNAKVVLERVAEDQLETARASLFAATREAALKKKRITEDLEEKISNETARVLSNSTNVTNATNTSIDNSTQEGLDADTNIQRFQNEFNEQALQIARQKVENVNAASTRVRVSAANRIYAEKVTLTAKETMLHAQRIYHHKSDALEEKVIYLNKAKKIFQQEAASLIAEATEEAREQASNSADEAAAVAEAQQLGKQAVEKIVTSVETESTEKHAEADEEAANERAGKARASWVVAAGMATKAQEKMKTEQEEETVMGGQVVSHEKVAGAVFAAKAAMATADELKAKFDKAQSTLARKTTIAQAAMAVHDEGIESTILPSTLLGNYSEYNKTRTIRKANEQTLKQLRDLYHRATQDVSAAKFDYAQDNKETQKLKGSLGEASEVEKRASYVHHYAARLHEDMLSQQLLHAQTKRASAELKLKKANEVVKSYQLGESALRQKMERNARMLGETQSETQALTLQVLEAPPVHPVLPQVQPIATANLFYPAKAPVKPSRTRGNKDSELNVARGPISLRKAPQAASVTAVSGKSLPKHLSAASHKTSSAPKNRLHQVKHISERNSHVTKHTSAPSAQKRAQLAQVKAQLLGEVDLPGAVQAVKTSPMKKSKASEAEKLERLKALLIGEPEPATVVPKHIDSSEVVDDPAQLERLKAQLLGERPQINTKEPAVHRAVDVTKTHTSSNTANDELDRIRSQILGEAQLPAQSKPKPEEPQKTQATTTLEQLKAALLEVPLR